MRGLAFQDQLGKDGCFGCGSLNEHGFRFRSSWNEQNLEEAVCVWEPQPFHVGPPGFLYGGLVSCIVDCNSVCTAMADAYRRERREIGSSPKIWYVTKVNTVEYIKPTPLSKPICLAVRIEKIEGRKTFLESSLFSEDIVCARGRVLAIRADHLGPK